MCGCERTDDFTTRACFAEWLAQELTREELASAVERAFRERGPRLPPGVRLDLRCFIEDRSTRALAECVALNEDPSGCEGFAAWHAERSAESRDPCATFGVAPADFCEDRGPGGE